MRTIKKLDSNTISQIAAGEIIENPASVCKELIENSIDAGATNILVQLSENLIDGIRVTDNGSGISEADLPLVFLRHTTSKLQSFEDLKVLNTLGFRGEALASISNISKITMITRTAEEEIGKKLYVEEGKIKKKEPIGASIGTSIYVENLFYNVPVRRKFLKSRRREQERILTVIEHIALSHPEISFHVQQGGRTILHSQGETTPINHIYSLLGRDIASNLLPISFDTASYRIKGFISNNKLYRSTSDREYLFVNGRSVRSPEISKVIRKQYYTLIPLNKYPVFIIYLDIDPILVDVNIHPQKHIVKLSEENYILTILARLVRSTLLPNRSIQEVEKSESEETEEEAEPRTIFDLAEEEKDTEKAFEQIVHKENNFSNDSKTEVEEIEESEIKVEEPSINYDKISEIDKKKFHAQSFDIDLNYLDYIGTVFNTYLLFEERKEENLLLVDQHAAHERILFEQIYTSLKSEQLNRQVLLKPELLSLGPKDRIKLEENLEAFNSLGFTIESFGEEGFVLREVPTSIFLKSPVDFIQQALQEMDDKVDIIEMNLYNIMRRACREAVKAGDKLSEIEAMKLMEQLKQCQTPFTCPHGRPTILRYSKREMEKMFLREG